MAERVARQRRRAGRLPILLALLLAMVSATVNPKVVDAQSAAPAGVALSGVVAPVQPTATGGRPDVRLVAKRGGTWISVAFAAAGCVAAYQPSPPKGRWSAPATEHHRCNAGRSDTYRGRGPPAVGDSRVLT
ncbi:hypothetical protein ACNTMW_24560 [Planosporangium sp. 12N6]|uniref:hypothetical protein n=1 Tax=Planosporangium spinosum TaxID=3402278 RepID=UPI003CF750A4